MRKILPIGKMYEYAQFVPNEMDSFVHGRNFTEETITTVVSAQGQMVTQIANQNGRKLEDTQRKLSSGKRINKAADDAARLAISTKITAQTRGKNQALRNTNDAISIIQMAEGGIMEVSGMMTRLRELAVQSA